MTKTINFTGASLMLSLLLACIGGVCYNESAHSGIKETMIKRDEAIIDKMDARFSLYDKSRKDDTEAIIKAIRDIKE